MTGYCSGRRNWVGPNIRSGSTPFQSLTMNTSRRRYRMEHTSGRSMDAYREKREMYPEQLLDHFQNPRNVGDLGPPAVTVEVSNPACGDILRLAVRMEGGVAVEVRYKVKGCTASIAAGSALTEWIAGKTTEQIAAFVPAVVDKAVGGLAVESKHAAVLCADGVKALLKRLVRA